jgi:hypothetical protein
VSNNVEHAAADPWTALHETTTRPAPASARG